jgi:membrane protein implicated in regulation of membrane protease activity
VYLHGELWEAEASDGDIAAGGEVVVEAVEGLTLRVAPSHSHSTEGVTT